MKTLVSQTGRMGHDIASDHDAAVIRVNEWKGDEHNLDASMAADIMALWSDQGIQLTYERRSQYQFPDSGAYFINKVPQVYHRTIASHQCCVSDLPMWP
jgi:hypothetical protein